MTTPFDAPRSETGAARPQSPLGYDPALGSEPVVAPSAFAAPGPDVRPGGDQRERSRRRTAALAGVTAIALAAGSGLAGAGAMLAFGGRQTSTATAAASTTSVSPVANSSTQSIADLVSNVDDEVVSLTVQGAQETDLGSGVVIRANGLIVTNNHVIAAAANSGRITVTFTDGKTATVVAADAGEDLAIVQASDVTGRPFATFADSGTVQVGDTVVAIGNELGLSNSVSAGIVSALHRKVSVAAEGSGSSQGGSAATTTYPDAIQTDAAINQGDSGGALFNMSGQVIGIDTAIATASSDSAGSVGIGFAIASNDVTEFIAKTLA